MALVVARARNGAIGQKGTLPWHLPADLRHFKRLTIGKPMVMGRKTFASLPGLLPGRRHIVLTRDTFWGAPGAEIVRSREEAIEEAKGDFSVIGGAAIFALFEPIADTVHLTEIHADPEADVFLPPFDPARWRETAREEQEAAGLNPAFAFVTLARRKAAP